MHAKRQGRAWYYWFAEDDSLEERKLILKLDLLIVPYAFIAYWIKYIDQANINNAYVSGLSTDLDFRGNQLVHLQTIYVVGAVLGQLPFAWLFPRFQMNYIIPLLELGWGIFTLIQYRANGYSELMAYRFMVGFFESAFFPGVHYVLGAWYRGDEIGRRGGVFYVGLTLGTLTASLIQSGASSGLDGVDGLAGWRWMYIITALMTIPVGIAGVFIWPGTPARPNMLFLSKEEIALARKRLATTATDEFGKPERSVRSLLRSIFTDWKVYVLTFWDILFWNAGSTSYGGYLLWLKSLHRYSTPRLNQLGATAPAAGIFYVLFINFGSDLFLGRTGAIALAHTWNFVAMVILVVWNVPEAAKWFAFNATYSQVAMSSVLYGWSNDILRHDEQERAITLVIMNTVAQSTTAWTGILTFPTVEAPNYRKGYSFCAACSVSLILFTPFVAYLHRRQERRVNQQDAIDPPVLGGYATESQIVKGEPGITVKTATEP
ncbi:hypothetical protein MBLNU459_g3910t1 [Dothideomycetes sp. NU459]